MDGAGLFLGMHRPRYARRISLAGARRGAATCDPVRLTLRETFPSPVSDEWQLQHRYMQVEVMAELAAASGPDDPRQIPCAA